MDFKRQKSVDWYDPKQLASTGVKAVVSSVFGNFNDKRETQAALDQDKEQKGHKYHQDKKDIWIDYIADLGDGFNATFSMATLLAKAELEVDGQKIPRGEILIMGGDQVYPTASIDEYNNRLKGPYKCAFPFDENDVAGLKAPHVFAIPGNHDWYDGLSNFLKVFSQGRAIGNWRTQQKRSYFALHLPSKVWVFGIDVQLNSDIDYNQILYFEEILKNEVEPGSKIILCTAEPTWVYYTNGHSKSNKNLQFFEDKLKKIVDQNNKPKAIQILTIAGDFHHYSRYQNIDGSLKITAGGGGAFMHPTQHLPQNIKIENRDQLTLKSIFPSAKDSKKLLIKNLKFPLSNYKMSLLLGGIYALVGWLFILKFPDTTASVQLLEVAKQILFSPAILVFLLLIVLGLGMFAETTPCNPKFKSSWPYALAGYLHGLAQAKTIVLTFFLLHCFIDLTQNALALIVIVLGCFLIGFLVGGFLFGLYLIFANSVLGNHDNEAYSALKWEGYKNFIRMHISENKLTIYPIGVKQVVNWSANEQSKKPVFKSNETLKYELIEEPIVIQF